MKKKMWIDPEQAKKIAAELDTEERRFTLARVGASMKVDVEINEFSGLARVALIARDARSGNSVLVNTSETHSARQMVTIAKRKMKGEKESVARAIRVEAQTNAS